MSLEENKALARRFVEEATANPDLLDQMMGEGAVFHAGGQDDSNVEALKQAIAGNRAAFPDWRTVAEDILAEGDKAVVRFAASATHTGAWAGFAPTHKSLAWDGTILFRFAGGKIVEAWEHENVYWVLSQLGLVPSWEELVEQANAKQA